MMMYMYAQVAHPLAPILEIADRLLEPIKSDAHQSFPLYECSACR